MTDLASGSRAKLVLEVGQVVRVSSTGTATVMAAYGAPDGVTTITAGYRDFGPYSVPAKLLLLANSGPAAYAVLQRSLVEVIQGGDGSVEVSGAAAAAIGETMFGGMLQMRDFGLDESGFSAALRAAIDNCVKVAPLMDWRCPMIRLAEGMFPHDGITVNCPVWVPLFKSGFTRVACEGQVSITNPFMWVRADLEGYRLHNLDDDGDGDFSAGAANVGEFICGPGRLQLSDMTNSGTLMRFGSGDGVMGPLYVPEGSKPIYTTKIGVSGVHIRGGQQSLQLTNYQVFSLEFSKLQINGGLNPVWTSTSTQGHDFGEQHLFYKPFISNTLGDAFTLNSAHQIVVDKGSITFTQGTICKFNADRARFHTISARLERFTKIADTSGSFPNSVITHGGRTHLIPTRRRTTSNPYEHYLRTFWDAASGQTYQLCPDEVFVDMGTSAAPYNQFTAHPSNLYLVSPYVDLAASPRCNVNQSTAAVLKASPIFTRKNAFPNGGFDDGTIGGWHKNSAGTISYQGGDGYDGNGCLEMTVSGGQCLANGPRIYDVRPGGKYAVDFLHKVLASGSPTENFAVQCVVHWFKRGVARTLSGSTPLTTTTGSNIITVASDANHGLRVDDMVCISGAIDTNGIAAANINGWRRVSAIASTVSWSFEAGAAASSGSAAGGASVVVLPPVTYLSDSATQSRTVDNTTSVTATGTGSISGTTLTISGVQFAVMPGATVGGAGVTGGMTIVRQLSGTPGADGDYEVSVSQNLSSRTITATTTGLKDLWLRHGGSLVIEAPAEAIASTVQVHTGSSHTGTVRFKRFNWQSLS